jgi:5-methylcytosine-specific restriction endonuclease McrA
MPYKNKENGTENAKKWKKENRNKVREYEKEYRNKNKNKINERVRKYYSEHKEEKQKQNREWMRKNKTRVLARQKIWKNTHPYSVWAERTKQAHKGNGYKIEIEHKELIELAKSTKECIYCGSKLNYERMTKKKLSEMPSLDRINGEKKLTKLNVQIICRKCNTIKFDRTHQEFVEYCKKIVKKFDIYGSLYR